jgi:hypothetical protein
MAKKRQHIGLDVALERFGDRIGQIRQDLYYCDASFTSAATRGLRATIQAGAYVYLAAAMEAGVKELLVAVLAEVSAQINSTIELRPTLYAIWQAPQLHSLQDLRGLQMWMRRSQVFDATSAHRPRVLAAADLPLDGRTLKIDHFETVWNVFGFDGTPLPSPLHRLTLEDLNQSRNDVAHGEEDAVTVAGRKSIPDMLALINRLEQIMLHLWEAADRYLTRRGYRR